MATTLEHVQAYVAALQAHDWGFQARVQAAGGAIGWEEQIALEEAQRLIDPDFLLWNQHAPAEHQRSVTDTRRPTVNLLSVEQIVADLANGEMNPDFALSAIEEHLRLAGDPNDDLRTFFAGHAPSEIPRWFEHPHEAMPTPPDHSDFSAEELEQFNGWRNDNVELEALTPRVRQLADAHLVYSRAHHEALMKKQADHYFAWRWAYADGMLKARAS